MTEHSYHSRRERVEDALAIAASTGVARIAHGKLARLHARSADLAVAATMRAFEGKPPIPRVLTP